MAKKTPTKPRKIAAQQRSRVTVDILLEATARILVKEGYDTASTNKIAAMAGISIGSLYQYFPNKDALVAATIDRHMNEMIGLIRSSMAAVIEEPIDVAVRTLVSVMIEAHRVNPQLHQVLYEQIPRTHQLENIDTLDQEACAMVHAFLDARRSEISVTDPAMAAFICMKTVETLTHAAVIKRSDLISSAHIHSFIDEVTRLVLGYLQGNLTNAPYAGKQNDEDRSNDLQFTHQ